MKIAFLFGPISAGSRPFDFSRIEDDPRGLTGTDGSCLGYARAMAARGHDVTLFVQHQRERVIWEGVVVRPYNDRASLDASYDAAIAWNDIAGLAAASPESYRILDTQFNDFNYVQPDDHKHVDLYATCGSESPKCVARMRSIAESQGAKAPWGWIPNGCDAAFFDAPENDKTPGLCIYTSSPDRGSHVAVEQWSRIRAAVPNAELRIYYHSLDGWMGNVDSYDQAGAWQDREHGRRARIVRDGLSQPGITHVGSVSRRRMAETYRQAMVLAYPVDTITHTETFCVSALEGCASGAIPILTDCDAIGEIYAGSCPMVSVADKASRFVDEPEKAREWADLVIRALTDLEFRATWRARANAFACRHAWPVLAAELERTIRAGNAAKGRKVA